MPGIKKKICVFLLLYIGINFPFVAQSPYFKSISLLKSHAPVMANLIFQDSKGFIWFATKEGLIKFDGIESYLFEQRDSISPVPITAIAEDSLGRIWIGHKSGLIEYYSANYFKKFKPEEGLGRAEISFIKFDSKGVLWYGTLGEGVYYFSGINRKRIYNLSQDEGLSDNNVYTMAEADDGRIYFGTDNGISILVRETKKFLAPISMKTGLPDNLVKHIVFDGQLLWIGTDSKGVCTYNIHSHQFQALKNWSFETLNTFTLKDHNDCWVSTQNNGVVRIKLDSSGLRFATRYSNMNGLPGNNSQTIFTDREKNIWIAFSKEVILGAASDFEFIDKKTEGFDYGSVFSFIVDSKGRYWTATQNGLFSASKNSHGQLQFSSILSQFKEIQSAFISLYQDSKGFIWAGTYGYGVFRINPETHQFIKYDIKNGLPDNNVLYITGNSHHVWLATAGGGASDFNLDQQTFKNYGVKEGLGSNYLYSIFLDSKGNTWFALDGKGTSLLKNGLLYNHILPDSLGINTIYAISEDKEGALWFLTPDKGLIRQFDGKFRFINESNGLKSNNIRSIIADKSGNIIMAGNEGVQVYLCGLQSFLSFGDERGLSLLEPNLNGISIDSTGTIWISENSGIIKYSPQLENQQKVKPKISLDKILLFFNSFASGKNTFKFNQNHFTFQYTGLWFQSSEKLNYRYKLENYDFDWSIPSHSRSVTYSNLPPGKYLFRVEVSYEPGQWVGNKSAIFEFRIKPPYYKTWWFILLSIFTIIISIYGYIKSRTAKLQQAKDELELEVQKRTKTILAQKDEISSQRDEIETQRDFVISQRDQIAFQHENITASIQCASRIQQAILPPEEDIELRLRDYFIFNRPMDIVSGDFYWISSKNNRILIVAADCTGHGVSGAFMSVLGISLLNKIIFSNPLLSASGILDVLRDEIKYALRQTGKQGEPQDGMDISLLIIENDKKDYQFAAANNAAYIVRNGDLIVLKPDRMPIGIYPVEVPFTNNTGLLYKDDIIYMCSDGFKDQFGGQFDKKFQSRQFHELLLNIAPHPMDKQSELINNSLLEWKNGSHLNDDILIMGFKVS